MKARILRWISWSFLIIAIIIHLVFISSLWTGMLDWLFHDTKFLLGQGADFFAYYQAGNNVLNGLSCYEIPESLVVPYLYPYRYLPYFAYSFGVIVNLMSPILAYWLWIGIVIVTLWLAVFRTQSLAKVLNRPDWEARTAMGMWFVFSPTYIELYLGQVTLFAGVLLFFALTNSSFVEGQNKRWSMTVFWITASLTKLIPYLIAPVLAGAGRVRAVLVAVIVTVVAIFVVPAGLASLQFFIDFNTARTMYISTYVGSHSLKMLILRISGQPAGDFWFTTAIFVGVFFTLAIIANLYSRDVWSCAGLFATSYFFIMTDVWEHHYTLILPLLVLAWIRGRPEDKARWIPLMLVLLLSLPMMPIIEVLSGLGPGVHPSNWSQLLLIIYHSSKVIPVLIFYGWLLITAYRTPREDSFLMSATEAFRNAWNGLITGSSPRIVEGILVRIDSEAG